MILPCSFFFLWTLFIFVSNRAAGMLTWAIQQFVCAHMFEAVESLPVGTSVILFHGCWRMIQTITVTALNAELQSSDHPLVLQDMILSPLNILVSIL